MGQTARMQSNPAGRARARRSGALLAGGALIASTVLTGCGSSLASATTTLAGVLDARVVHPNGSTVAAVDGLKLRKGDVVRTGPTGRAELHTRGRVVYEGSDAAVQVLDGARSDLRHGALVVDAQHGPGLDLVVAGLSVRTPGGAATRAERSVTVRIAALAGAAGIDSPSGRHLTVDPLTQAVLGGDALPDSTAGSPLRLTDDDGEAHAVPLLVRDDLALNTLAAGLDSTGQTTARVVTAAWHAPLSPLPSGVGRSEQVLPLVIAIAVHRDATARYSSAVSLRQAGASWGVVAHRLDTTSAAVLAALQAFEKGVATGRIGSIPSALSYLASAGAGHGPGSTTGPGRAGGSHSGSGSNGGSPGPRPSPSSTDPVGSTIDTVMSLLPSPTPTPTPTSLPSIQVPSLPTSVLPTGSLLTPATAPLPSP